MTEPNLVLVNCLRDSWSPPIQLAYVATYLREHGGFKQVTVLDVNCGSVLKQIREIQPTVVGLSALTPLYSEVIQLARAIKKANPKTLLVIGGHHISMCPESLDPIFDTAVLGEGEETMLELMELIRRKSKVSALDLIDIKGLAFWDDDGLHQTQRRDLIDPVDTIPIPDRSFLPGYYIKARHPIYSMGWRRMGIGNLFTGRGCPYDCKFCSSALFWKKVRLHSVERVVAEVEQVANLYHTQFIHFEDDLFAVNKKRVREVIEGLRSAGLLGRVYFACQPRVNLIDEGMCELLKEMGTVLVSFGFESGNEQMLHYLKGKSVSPDMGEYAVRTCKKYGLHVQGSVILGNPGETWEQMQDTRKFVGRLYRAGIDDLWPFIATPLPGTPFWDYARENNIVRDDNPDWRLWQFTRPNPKRPVLYDPGICEKDFKDLYFSLQAYMEKRRPRLPVSARLRRLPRMIGRAGKMPGLAWEVFKHRYLAYKETSE